MEAVILGGASMPGYADSLDSSPRSRGGESWDEPFPSSAAAAAASKLRLMCSYGGRIVPRPTDRSLCYLGGETRIVVVERLSALADLSARLSRSLLGGRPFTLKYQLPNEDLDSLISVTADEDLENMIEEYDRIAAAAPNSGSGGGSTRSSRLRLFLFPSKPESAPSSIGSLLDDSKSETWFVDALNNAIGMDGLPRGLSADSASVNCLLGLEDDSSVHSRRVGGAAASAAASDPERLLPRPDSFGKLARHGQDAHSVPDSPMLDTNSSFGSASSAPSLSNLPPIRVRLADRTLDQRITGLEDHFSQMNQASAASAAAAGQRQDQRITGLEDHFSQMNQASAASAAAAGQRQEELLKETGFGPHHPPPPHIPLPATSAATPTISPTENPSRVFSSDDEKSEHGGVRRPPQLKPSPVDAPISDSATRPIYFQDWSSPAAPVADPISDMKRDPPISDPGYRMQMQAPDAGYVLPPMQPEQLQQQHLHPQQFLQANTHYVHPATGAVLPYPSYYQMPHQYQQSQQPQQFDQQIPMYFMPMRHNQPYNLSMQPSMGDAASNPPPAGKPAAPLPKAPARPELVGNMYRNAAGAAAASPALQQAPLFHVAGGDQSHQYAGMGYHMMHHHQPSQPAAAMANYGYEFADPAHPSPVYYTQTSSAPALPPQYPTMAMSAAGIPDATLAAHQQQQQQQQQQQLGEVKQTRAS